MDKIIHTKQTTQPFILLPNRGLLASNFWLGEVVNQQVVVNQQTNVEKK